MRAVISSNFRNNMKYFFDYVTESNEIVIVTRPAGQEIVILSMDKYSELTAGMIGNVRIVDPVKNNT